MIVNVGASIGGERTHDVAATWTSPPGVAAVYYVEIGRGAGQADVALITTTEPTIPYRADAEGHYLRVRAASGAMLSAPSNEVFVSVVPPGCGARPLGPILLPVSASNGETTISWLPASGSLADHYLVEATGPTSGRLGM